MDAAKTLQAALKQKYLQRAAALSDDSGPPWKHRIFEKMEERSEQAPNVSHADDGHTWLDSNHAWRGQSYPLSVNKLLSPLNRFREIDSSQDPPRVVYVIGVSGIGKTTFSWHVAADDIGWCNNPAPLWPQFEWKLHVTLRDAAMLARHISAEGRTGAVYDAYDMLFHHIFKSTGLVNSTDELRLIAAQWTPENCLLILDGLDEVDIRGSDRALQCLLDFDLATLLITVRTHGVMNVGRGERIIRMSQNMYNCRITAEDELLNTISGTALADHIEKLSPFLLHNVSAMRGLDPSAVTDASIFELCRMMCRYVMLEDPRKRPPIHHVVFSSDREERQVLELAEELLCETAWAMLYAGEYDKIPGQWLLQQQYDDMISEKLNSPLWRETTKTMQAKAVAVAGHIVEPFYGMNGKCVGFVDNIFQEYYCAKYMDAALLAGETHPAYGATIRAIQRLCWTWGNDFVLELMVSHIGGRSDGQHALNRLFELFTPRDDQVVRLGMYCARLDLAKYGHTTDVGSPLYTIANWLWNVCLRGERNRWRIRRVEGGQRCIMNLNSLSMWSTPLSVVKTIVKHWTEVCELHMERCLSYNRGPEDVPALADILRDNTTLTSLVISNNTILPDEMNILCDALQVNSTLQTLDMSDNSICHAPSFGHHSSDSEDSENDAGGDVSSDVMVGARAVAETLARHVSLREVHMRKCYLGNDGAAELRRLSQNTTMIKLNLSCNNIMSLGAAALADMLRINSTLQSLDISINQLGVDGVRAIAAALNVNGALTELNLSMCDIGGDEGSLNFSGLRAFSNEFAQNTTLRRLNLSNIIDTTSEGVIALANALRVNSTLQSLDMELFIDTSEDGWRAVSEAIATHPSLRELNLQSCHIEDEGLGILLDSITSQTTLNIRKNSIRSRGAIALANALCVNSTMTSLDMTGNYIGDDGARAMTACVNANPRLGVKFDTPLRKHIDKAEDGHQR